MYGIIMIGDDMKKFIILFMFMFLLTGCGKKYYCDPGYELKEEKCYKMIIKAAAEEYECKSGDKLDFKTCTHEYETLSLMGSYPYFTRYCITGQLRGLYCVSITEYEPTIKYSCDDGYTLEGDKCILEETIDANMRWEL